MASRTGKELEILIVDDDKIICFLQHKALLRLDLNYKISIFYNGKDTLEYISNNKNKDKRFLILLDINMPIMNGWEFLDRCEDDSRCPELKVVMVTSSINSSDKVKAFEYTRVVGFFEKPLTMDKAREAVMPNL